MEFSHAGVVSILRTAFSTGRQFHAVVQTIVFSTFFYFSLVSDETSRGPVNHFLMRESHP